jgi:hypothetical protein
MPYPDITGTSAPDFAVNADGLFSSDWHGSEVLENRPSLTQACV